ncbi:hypothetical protein GOV13_02810 [Candidatus Pacearchaeota archaeon]|nr:hypothetical protein [Candidatus Pacearchaeota archaeon]
MAISVKGGEAKPQIQIDDGLHYGVIKTIEERPVEGKDYTYLDLYLEVEKEGEPLELKVGFALPNKGVGLNEKQDLGKLVIRVTGNPIEPGKDYDLDQILVGKRVQFVTLTGEKYVEVTKESVKPAVEKVVSTEGKVPDLGGN